MKLRFITPVVATLLLALGACAHGPEETPGEAVAEAPQAAKAAPAALAPAVAEAPPEGECGCKDEPEAKPEVAKVEEVSVGGASVRGPAAAPVTVVMFTDFECPFCARADATVRALEQRYPGKLRVAFRNQPLPFHEHARAAARAALAAGEQGKFWEYKDALFAHQGALDRVGLERHAADLGLDLVRFRAALDAPRTAAVVDADMAEAKRLGVTGTPTFFVNGRRLIGAQPLAAFTASVDAALAARR
jgi:protein-disulfide isomerase